MFLSCHALYCFVLSGINKSSEVQQHACVRFPLEKGKLLLFRNPDTEHSEIKTCSNADCTTFWRQWIFKGKGATIKNKETL